jgi:pentatricopeptide repeat protein
VVRTDLVEGRDPALDEFTAYEQTGQLENMVKQRPDDAEVWQALGRTRELGPVKAQAGEAYGKALELFLRERQFDKAVEVWDSMRECSGVPELPPDLRFQLACALDEQGHKEEAFPMFGELSRAGSLGPHVEASLMRAAEAARVLPDLEEQAVGLYQRLLDEFPYSTWRDLALDRLRDLGALAHLAVAQPVSAQPAEKAAAFSDPYGMGAVGTGGDTEDL